MESPWISALRRRWIWRSRNSIGVIFLLYMVGAARELKGNPSSGRFHPAHVGLTSSHAAASTTRSTTPATSVRSARPRIRRTSSMGKTVDLNDFYQAAKPARRDFSPIMERLQRRDLQRRNEFMVGDLARKYHLSPAQQDTLRGWLNIKSDEQVAQIRWHNLKDSTNLEEMIKSGRKAQGVPGLDEFMADTQTGDDRTRYQTDRLPQRVAQVQAEADRRVSRLNSVVNLDDAQQDQVFALMARSSPDFDPSMQLEGLGGGNTHLAPGQSRDEAIMNVLRPEQRQQYEEHRLARRAEASKEMEEVGLRLPESWDRFGDD